MWLYMHVHANRKIGVIESSCSTVHCCQTLAAICCNDPFGFNEAWALLEGCWDEVNAESLDDHHHCDWHQGHRYWIQQPESKQKIPVPGEHRQFDMKKNSGVSEAICDCLRCVSRLCMKVPQLELQTTNFGLPSMPSKSTPSAQGSKTPKTLWVVQSATIFGCLWHLYLTSFTIIQNRLTSFNTLWHLKMTP